MPVADEKTGSSKSEERAGRSGTWTGTHTDQTHGNGGEITNIASTAGLIGLAALVLEPEVLIPVAAGAGLVYASRMLTPIVGAVLAPAVKTIVKAGYSVAASASEMASSVSESMQDAVAEARSEHQSGHTS
jgi:hypothetical protein